MPTVGRHAARMAKRRGDGITPDGHDPEVVQPRTSSFPGIMGGRRRRLLPGSSQLMISGVVDSRIHCCREASATSIPRYRIATFGKVIISKWLIYWIGKALFRINSSVGERDAPRRSIGRNTLIILWDTLGNGLQQV